VRGSPTRTRRRARCAGRRATRAGRVVLAAALALATPGGCTLPVPFSGHELLVGYVEVDEPARRVRRVTPGLALSVYGARPGLSLGWADTSWFAAARDADGRPAWRPPARTPGDGFRLPLGWQWSDGATRQPLGWLWHAPPGLRDADRAVLAVHHGWLGLDLAWAAHERGLGLGLGRSVTVVAPVDADGAWLLDFSSAAPSSGRFQSLDPGGPAP